MEETRSLFSVGVESFSTGDEGVLVQVTKDKVQKVDKNSAAEEEHPFTNVSITLNILKWRDYSR